MARHDAISADCDRVIREMLLRGDATRTIARRVGCSDKTVEFRRAALKKEGAVFATCKCGRPVTHRGTCKWKVKRFREDPNPKRGYMERERSLKGWEQTIENAKAVAIPKNNSPKRIIKYFQEIVPRTLYTAVREDVVSDLCEMFYSGVMKLHEAPENLPKLISRNHELAFGPWGGFSLDAILDLENGKSIVGHGVTSGPDLRYVSSLGGWERGETPGFHLVGDDDDVYKD